MMKKIVFFDLDGTLLTHQKTILESTKQAIRLLKENGVYVAIATGRVPTTFQWIREELDIESYVSINGQYVVFEGKEIYENPVDKQWLHELTQRATEKGHAVGYCNHEHVKVNEPGNPNIENSYAHLDINYPEIDGTLYQRAPIYQAHLYCDRASEKWYVDQYPAYKFVRWGDYALDVLPAGGSKAVGIQQMLKQVGIKLENSYAFGDALNDIEMLETVGTGIAMGNGVPEAKKAADMVTTSCDEDGILNGLIAVGLLPESVKKEKTA
ncbi:hydrolase Cof [Priestia koreensis]|uniref:Hydrolase Cof n=2 Tax=Priestia koreensis TaxID=284581 RepID=A0A0M0KT11_9BACI|nr:Cof-type HAD-IIB family hydrolase [Priestia koreensis]KOO41954.1 hydrolase Cof [Priestia koreensis]